MRRVLHSRNTSHHLVQKTTDHRDLHSIKSQCDLNYKSMPIKLLYTINNKIFVRIIHNDDVWVMFIGNISVLIIYVECKNVSPTSDEVGSYLRDECPISFEQLRFFRAASEQLPDFISQRLGNSLAYERFDLSWPLADILMPAFEDVVPAVEKVFIGDVFAHNAGATEQRFIIV